MSDEYGAYSQKQFEAIEDNNFPYIYYQKVDTNEIVQITEIFKNKENKSLFNDAIYFGKVKYYGAYKIKQYF
jgi:hypothetical protein